MYLVTRQCAGIVRPRFRPLVSESRRFSETSSQVEISRSSLPVKTNLLFQKTYGHRQRLSRVWVPSGGITPTAEDGN